MAIQEISQSNLKRIKNPIFRDYASMYLDIFDNFIAQVEQFGLPFRKTGNEEAESRALLDELAAIPGVELRNDRASVVYNYISGACIACKKGVGTTTSHISFRCHRNCFFCFNPNQDNYESHLENKNDWRSELDGIKASGGSLTHIALTGGEPLLYPDEAVDFFAYAAQLFPDAHLRLYTSGDLLTDELAKRLAGAGLDEIRFSYKIEDTPAQQEHVLANMAMAKQYIADVIVEMPVMPDAEEHMQGLLLKLDEIGIRGMNLLELCFPYNNAPAFAARGFELRYPPFRTLYNFWYAGGLPIAGSEIAALRLIRFGAEHKLKLGLHYCSLENKNFGQMYRQNKVTAPHAPFMLFSEKDYYLKTVKAFGKDAEAAMRVFDKRGIKDYSFDSRSGYVSFHPSLAKHLKGRAIELALSVNVIEEREGEFITRELKLLRCLAEDIDESI